MPPERRPLPRWAKLLGYAAFALFSLLFWLYVTFPYEAVKRRIQTEANGAGLSVQMGSIGPGLFGVTAHDLKIAKLDDGTSPTPPEALLVTSLALRPALFPPGVAVRSNLLGGTLHGSVGGLRSLSIDLAFDDLDPSKGNVKGLTGLDLEGKLAGDLDFTIPRATAATPGARGPAAAGQGLALNQADGTLNLDFNGVTIKGGTVEVPYYGQMTPFDVPRISLGDIDGRLVVEKGQGKLETFHGKGDDVELLANGTLKLANNARYSEADINLKLKALPDFVKRLGIIGAGLSVLPADRQDPTFRLARISGFVGRPNFGPGRP